MNVEAYIITKYLIRNHGILVTEVVTKYIDQIPNRPHTLDTDGVWFLPSHKKVAKAAEIPMNSYWDGVKGATVAGLIKAKLRKGKHWYSVQFDVLHSMLEKLDMEAEIAIARHQLEEIAVDVASRNPGA